MNRRIKKSDYLFFAALGIITLYYVLLLFQTPFIKDEIFFPTIPLRLINGESLGQHEWHLTQFSALFQYPLVKLWLFIKGSTDGILLFFRCCYLLIHSVFAVIIYAFFRKYNYWAVAAAMVFFTYLPYGMFVISYASLLVIFMILLVFSLLTIHKKPSVQLFVFAGFCYGCCCICNPALCVLFFLHIFLLMLWPYKEKLFLPTLNKAKVKLLKKSKSSIKNIENSFKLDSYNVFFTKKALIYSCLGISIIAVIAIVFFLATGGNVTSLINNIANMLKTSEYDSTTSFIFEKIKRTFDSFKSVSFNLPFLLPGFILAFCFDKKRNIMSHKMTYLFIAFSLSVFYIFGIAFSSDFDGFMFTFPLTLFSTTCYIFTEKKNKELFYCVWCPSLIVAFIQSAFSNTILLAFGIIITISNIVGVIFIHDLYKEMAGSKGKDYDNKGKILRYMLIASICIQLFYQCGTDTIGKLPTKETSRISKGPLSSLYIKTNELSDYNKTIEDIEAIKDISEEDSPVLILSDSLYPYIHLDRPFATYTSWNCWKLYPENLKLYYEANKDRLPEYIYLSFKSEYDYEDRFAELDELFEYTTEELSNGLLLKVENYKLS